MSRSPPHAGAATGASAGAAPAGDRAPFAFDARRALALALAAYAVAAACLVLWYGNRAVFVDEAEYLAIAGHLVDSGTYMRDGNGPDALRPPGYPFALTPFALVGDALWPVRAAQLALLAVMAVALARSRAVALPAGLAGPGDGEGPWRDWRAVLVIGLLGASPVIPFTANLLFPQTLVAGLFVAVLLWTLAPGRVHGPASAVGTGLVCSFAIVATPTAATIAPLAAWTLARRSRAPFACAVLTLAASLALPAAWTARNRVVLGEWIPISRNVSSNLGIAWTVNEASADGVDLAPGATKGDVADPLAGGPVQVVIDLVSAPGEYLHRLKNFFDSDNKLQTEGEMSSARETVLAASYYSLLALVLLRLALLRRAPLSEAERAVLLLYAMTALFHALVFARVRYRLPFDLLLLLPAANALLVAAASLLDRRRARPG